MNTFSRVLITNIQYQAILLSFSKHAHLKKQKNKDHH